jgi:hypothetical protein
MEEKDQAEQKDPVKLEAVLNLGNINPLIDNFNRLDETVRKLGLTIVDIVKTVAELKEQQIQDRIQMDTQFNKLFVLLSNKEVEKK